MSLEQELASFREAFRQSAPAGRVALYDAKIEELLRSFAIDDAIGTGDRAPDFELPDQDGNTITLKGLVDVGPTVITFYRGGWCPYCNLQLRAYQLILPEINALGAKLVAISPQLPDRSLETAEANTLSFSVLSDVANRVSRKFGLVFSLAEELRLALVSNGKALPAINGDETWELLCRRHSLWLAIRLSRCRTLTSITAGGWSPRSYWRGWPPLARLSQSVRYDGQRPNGKRTVISFTQIGDFHDPLLLSSHPKSGEGCSPS